MTPPPSRQETGRRSATSDRRRVNDRRAGSAAGGRVRHASWSEQKIQFITRYVFFALGFLFFNLAPDFKPTWLTLWQINAFLIFMVLINTFNFWHASRDLYAVWRYRFAMWLDIIGVSVCILNDPYEIPPTLIVYILVVLGNGMRYGMPFFAEAVIGSFAGGSVALYLRYLHTSLQLAPGMIFLTLFSAIVLVYAYILMGRIESSRRTLEHSSSTDTLTGLLNRRALMAAADDLFDRVNRDGGRLVLMFADMDRFKGVNDGFGHATGDQVLQKLGDILLDSVRDGDVAARYGGDEFVILLQDTTLDEAEPIALRIQARVNDYAGERGLDFSVTIALGEAPLHGNSIDTLLGRVDEALYRSKAEHGAGGIGRAVVIAGS